MSIVKFQVEYLIIARELLNISKSYIAKKVNIHHTNYNRLEAGKVDPLFKNFLNIVSFFEMQGVDFNNFEDKNIKIGKKELRIGLFKKNFIVIARNILKLTQEEVALKTKINRSNYQLFEAGKSEIRLSTAKSIINYFESKGIDFQKIADLYAPIIEQEKHIQNIANS